MAKTMEDWFLRGGRKPDSAEGNGGDVVCRCGNCWPADIEICPDCGAPLTGKSRPDSPHGNGEAVLQDWLVTVSRTKTVQQTAEIRVKAHSEEEALDLAEDRAGDRAENWPWKDSDDTEEYEAVEAEVAT